MDNRKSLPENKKGLMAKCASGMSRLVELYSPRTWKEKGLLWSLGMALVTYAVVVIVLGVLWSRDPDLFDVRANALNMADNDESKLVTGYLTTAATVRIAETLLDKPGGYLSNDVSPPGVYLDNMPNWEFGNLVAVRDMVRALRNDFSRSQTQSVEDKDLMVADPQFNYDSESWILPSTESEYRKGIVALRRYLDRLADEQAQDGQFFTRADNLSAYLVVVEKRLGSVAQRLGASVGDARFNVDLAGDPNASQSTPTPAERRIQTEWLQIDDNFYEARGYSWGLLHLLKGLQSDFQSVLQDKNANVSLQQVIRELEGANEAMWSPIILNGTGFGLLANHSLVMTSYISRANAAIIDLRDLLTRG
jgi:hypothetical protein